MSQALFEAKNWSATKEALTEGLTGQRKTTMEEFKKLRAGGEIMASGYRSPATGTS